MHVLCMCLSEQLEDLCSYLIDWPNHNTTFAEVQFSIYWQEMLQAAYSQMIWGCLLDGVSKCAGIVFTRQVKSPDFLHFGLNTKGAGSNHNSAFFHCWSFTLFKPSLFIGLLYRPCLLFFTPFTPLSRGCLPLHFMPTSITLHRSKWSGPSSVSATCLFKCIAFFCLQPQTVLQHPKMCPRNEFRAAETIRRNYFFEKGSKRLFACICTSIRLHLFLLWKFKVNKTRMERPEKSAYFTWAFNMQNSQPSAFLTC